MRGLMALAVAMGVLIVAGTAVVGITIVRRAGAARATASGAIVSGLPVNVVLDEPPGTRMVALAPWGERLAVLLQGGGPDRVVLIDAATAHTAGRIALPR